MNYRQINKLANSSDSKALSQSEDFNPVMLFIIMSHEYCHFISPASL